MLENFNPKRSTWFIGRLIVFVVCAALIDVGGATTFAPGLYGVAIAMAWFYGILEGSYDR